MRLRFSEKELHRLSRDKRLIAQLALLAGSIFVIIAFFLPKSPPAHLAEGLELPTAFDENASSEERAATVLKLLRRTLTTLRNQAEGWDRAAIEEHILDRWLDASGPRELFLDYSQAARLNAEEARIGFERLKVHADQRPLIRFANELLADIYRWRGETEKALTHYRLESQFPGATYARNQILDQLIIAQDREALAEFLRDPNQALDHHSQWLRIGVMLRDPSFILRGIVLHDYADLPPLVLVFSLPVAFLWFWILKKMCFIASWRSKPILFGVLGVILGVMSTTATLFAVVWQESIWGLQLNGEPLNDVFVYVLGVGVREETIKFLFFLPLVPWLYQSRQPQTVLIAAACVGLGFAVQENIGYFQRYGGTLARFVTANFFHILLTGTLGFAFCRFLYTPRQEWNRFLATYIVVVLVHGAYDFLSTQTEGAFFGIMLFCLSAYFFFELVEKHCPQAKQTISPLSVFVIGCSIIFGCSLVAASASSASFHQTFLQSGNEILSTVPLMFLYINRFRNA